MSTVVMKAMVNPKDPTDIAIRRADIDSSDGLRYFRPFNPPGAQLILDEGLADWREVEIEMSVPRVFNPGDVVTVEGERVVRSGSAWWGTRNDRYFGLDRSIEFLGYTYLGNVDSL